MMQAKRQCELLTLIARCRRSLVRLEILMYAGPTPAAWQALPLHGCSTWRRQCQRRRDQQAGAAEVGAAAAAATVSTRKRAPGHQVGSIAK